MDKPVSSLTDIRLLAIQQDGRVHGFEGEIPSEIRTVFARARVEHAVSGDVPPWSGYVTLLGDRVVGCGGFLKVPADGSLEVKFSTLPEYRNCGVGGATLRALIARIEAQGRVAHIYARTPTEESVGTRLLVAHGFEKIGAVKGEGNAPAWLWERGTSVAV